MAWWTKIKEHNVQDLQRCHSLPHYDLDRPPFMWGGWFHPQPVEFKYKQPFHYENPHLKILFGTSHRSLEGAFSCFSKGTVWVSTPINWPSECFNPHKFQSVQGPLLKMANSCRLSGIFFFKTVYATSCEMPIQKWAVKNSCLYSDCIFKLCNL